MLTFGNPLGALSPLDFKTAVAKTSATQFVTAQEPQAGQCSPDGQFVWIKATASSPGHWERLRAGQTCQSFVPSGTGPDVRDQRGDAGGGGGVSVTDSMSYRTLKANLIRQTILENRDDTMRAIALAPTLPICPESSLTSSGVCYRGPKPSLNDMLLAPGSFTVFGVPFHVSELLSNGRFEKNGFVPTPEQRFKLDMAILERSHYEFRNRDLGLPIQALLDGVPDMRVGIPGFSLNPVEPTVEEMTEPGGAQHWVARGGYFLSYNVLTGKIPVTGYGDTRGFPINVCASIQCACPQDNAKFDAWRAADYSQYNITGGVIPADQSISWLPNCIGASITEGGGLSSEGGTPAVWNAFIAVNEANPNEYYLHLVIKPEAWTSKMAGWIGEQLAKLGKMFCATAPAVQQQLVTSMAEVCVDKQQKPCTKGTKDCTCTKPPKVQQASVGVFNVWTNHWCGEFMQEYGDKPPQEAPDPNAMTPQVPPELIPESKMKWWHWGLLLGAGLGAGYFLLRR